MAFETVTGYCWPQSVEGGGTVGAAPLLRRRTARVRRGRPRRGRAHGRVQRRRRPGRQPRHPDGRPPPRLRLARGARARRRPDLAVGLLRGRPRRSTSTASRVAATPSSWCARRSARPPRRSCWRWPPTPGTPTTTSAAATSTPAARTVSLQRPMSPGYLYKPPGLGRRVTTTAPPDPQMAAHVGYLAAQPPLAVRRLGGLARLGAAVPAVGRGEGLRHRRRHQRRPRGPPRRPPRRRPFAVPLGRPRRVLVGPDARHRRGASSAGAATPRSSRATPRSGRCASRTRRPRARPRRWSATRASSSRTRCSAPTASAELTSIWSDHLIERPENHMTGVSFARGGYHRIGKRATQRRRRLHDPPARPLAVRRHRASATATCSAPAATTVGYECDGCDFTYRDGLPYPTGVDGTPADFEILGTAPAAHFTRDTATRPPAPNEPSEVEFIAVAPVRRQPDAGGRGAHRPRPRRARHLHVGRRAASWSRRAAPTGPTAWPAATPRSSRSPATSSTASAPDSNGGSVARAGTRSARRSRARTTRRRAGR